MYSLTQQNALNLLDRYFSETSLEVIQTEIKEVFQRQFEGPTIDEYFFNFHQSHSNLASESNGKLVRKSKNKGLSKLNNVYNIAKYNSKNHIWNIEINDFNSFAINDLPIKLQNKSQQKYNYV